ncbi:DeoR/GlpR family DNA-binding transcription regulator [Companilactobacillus kimchii]|uniref:Lactose phosphotransferase system repressor n=2 Tax=Companilactobacillus kimchii TaxID=2801452 RepID=A0ABR5NSP6_9LACO|nr:DeoR/GlpR family DNA-binding transcription regulator [Companilactobacillus kimchii]KRK51214.1 transcription regulator [Companilactobacillus kimchii DSM 13961 = JCM 10707]OWF34304.1 putative HTH-type transcriptional regulator FruR [Companilactobacillus kimchii]GEO46225.1 DeoR family transcriptional regulator [Companilactobacillus paralimentarius]
MPKDERISSILNILETHQKISVKRLIDLTGESTSTMRRDLIILEQAGKIQRTFGMVSLLPDSNIEYSSPYRLQEQVNEKKLMCHLLSKIIKDNQAMYIDPSTTLSFLPPFLKDHRNLNIITDNLRVAVKTGKMSNIHVFITGGELKPNSDSIIGSHAIQDLAMFRPQLAIMSCSSLDMNGAYMANVEQANIKRQMLANAREGILLADHTKFKNDSSDYVKLAEFPAWTTLITDRKPPIDFLVRLRRLNVKIIYPNFKNNPLI